MRRILFLFLGLPLLLSGCKVVVWGYTNTSSASTSPFSVGRSSGRAPGLTLMIHVATSKHRALQAKLSSAQRSASSMRQSAADLAQAKAEEAREAIQQEIEEDEQDGKEPEESDGRTGKGRYPS